MATRAARAATRVDRGAILPWPGLIAALPVVAVLSVGMAVNRPVAAVTMGAGAMLSGVAWRGGGGPATPPLGTMAAAAVGLAVATVAGTLTGAIPWLHLGILALFCLGAGLLTALGRRGSVVGIQSVIAFVVFGRFPENVSGAFTLAGLVLAGGATQIAFAALVARPPTWRQQRTAVAAAYRGLAALAAAPGTPSVAAAGALDQAEARLSGPALLADPAAMTLAALVNEGRRIRLELIALAASSGQSQPEVAERFEDARRVLDLIADTIEDRGRSDPEVSASADRLRISAVESSEEVPDIRAVTDARLAALAGQLRAAARLTTQSSLPPGLRHLAHPTRGSRLPLSQLPGDLRRLRSSINPGSSAGRHAVRLAVVVTAAELIAQRASLPRGYWAVIAAATVLRPEFGATFTRGAERLLGTLAGVVVATLLAAVLHPGVWGIVGLLGVCAWVTYAVFPASFALGTAAITAVIVFLLHPVAPSTTAIALDRGIDTLIGGALALCAYALWPTWSGRSVQRRLAGVLDAQRRYLAAVLGHVIAGTEAADAEIRPLARRARLAYSEAEAAVTLTQSEPVRGADPAAVAGTLVELRRIVYAIHSLRVDAAALPDRRPQKELAPLAEVLDRALSQIGHHLRGGESVTGQLPPLRRRFREAMQGLTPAEGQPLRAPLDELIDALNTLATELEIPLP